MVKRKTCSSKIVIYHIGTEDKPADDATVQKFKDALVSETVDANGATHIVWPETFLIQIVETSEQTARVG